MNLGNLMLYLATALGVMVLVTTLRERGQVERTARWAYIGMTAALTIAMARLFHLFLTHRFEYSYVYGYSSRDLPLGYLISSVWAGQEGTFLLWAFFGALIGLFLLNRRSAIASRSLLFFTVTQLFLLVLMLVKSPFEMLAQTPPDGRGLNPLLQDPWMVIHPPIIFIGYAALAVPFAQAMAALVAKKFEGFAATAFPWVAFSVASLGAGIFIGGFWAYKVLGWGGYWGWDPVENSSLIPWLTALALLHGLILFRRTPKLLKTSIALAVISSLLVVYGTFLTRSGVLADFSVHSFADLGINAYLVVYMIGVTIVSLVTLAIRTQGVRTEPIAREINSREFGLVFGLMLLVITAGLVLIGTSAPILTRIGGQASNVSLNYYNSISLPLGVLIALTLTLSPFLIFGRTPWRQLFQHAAASLVLAVGAVVVAIIAGVTTPEHLVLAFGSVGALSSNIIGIIRFSEGRILRMGGHLTHAGFALMLLGILGSSGYGTYERISLTSGETKQALGYDVQFNDLIRGEKPNQNYLDVELEQNGETIPARPKMYFSDYTNSVMRNPHIVKGVFSDLYIAPIEYIPGENHDHGHTVQLSKGQTQQVGDWELTFASFDMGNHDQQTGSMQVAAVIDAKRGGQSTEIRPVMTSGPGGLKPVPMTIPGTDIEVALTGMRVEQQAIQLSFEDPSHNHGPSGASVALELSTKPLVNWVWAGVIIITLGSCISFVRRWRESEL
ncbi:MAG: hypothetical protein GF341_13570 [candidate division Zixibacteria bacterium]|nr:hypothetical protein [candidate division Zixibacteria bacterium]